MKDKLHFTQLCITLLTCCFVTIPKLAAQNRYWVPTDPPKSHYKIEAKIDVQNKVIKGTEIITLPNHAEKEISVIAIDWSISEFKKIEISMD